ncbi:MAG: efflux RND transporter periplasmic adaptor subunit [Bryobacteraceae bacterium]
MSNISNRSSFTFGAVLFAAAALAGCGGSVDASKGPAGPPPPAVSVVEVQPEDIPIYNEYAAQTYARDLVEVRGRVDGYIEKRLFQVGADVKAGQPLYVLDLRPYQAEVAKAKGELEQAEASLDFARKQVALAQAEADLAQAEANLLKAKQDVDRLRPLVKADAASQQDLDNSLAAFQANQANVNAKKANVEQTRLSTKSQIATGIGLVESRKASLRTAELNLEYGTITAPISGRIGDSLLQVGGLVSRNSAQPLTTIVPLDPIWVRFKVSESAHLIFERRTDKLQVRQRPLELILSDGSIHPYPGHIENLTNQIDPKTGTLEVQGTFPNPQRILLPGQFGRIRIKYDDKKDVIAISQRAITDLQGLQSVFTVGPDNKVQPRFVVTGDRVGDRVIVQQGLKPGDRVIVEGVQKARPGAVVNPKPWVPDRKPSEGAGK